MIDQWRPDRTGWARFSVDMTMRYRLARSLTGAELSLNDGRVWGAVRVVFLMLNPSTADAFGPDPTVTECRKRAVQAGAHVLEVVNLFAYRTPYPTDLRRQVSGSRGADATNDEQILMACTGAHIVVAAWGNDGDLDGRDAAVRRTLSEYGIPLHHLGITKEGQPKHPMARGRHRIPADMLPVEWT